MQQPEPVDLCTSAICDVDPKPILCSIQVADPQLRLWMLGKDVPNAYLLVILQPHLIPLSREQRPIVFLGDVIAERTQQVEIFAFDLFALPVQPQDGWHGGGSDVDDH